MRIWDSGEAYFVDKDVSALSTHALTPSVPDSGANSPITQSPVKPRPAAHSRWVEDDYGTAPAVEILPVASGDAQLLVDLQNTDALAVETQQVNVQESPTPANTPTKQPAKTWMGSLTRLFKYSNAKRASRSSLSGGGGGSTLGNSAIINMDEAHAGFTTGGISPGDASHNNSSLVGSEPKHTTNIDQPEGRDTDDYLFQDFSISLVPGKRSDYTPAELKVQINNHILHYNEFLENLDAVLKGEMVFFKIGNDYYHGQNGMHLLLSLLLYGQPLPNHLLQPLVVPEDDADRASNRLNLGPSFSSATASTGESANEATPESASDTESKIASERDSTSTATSSECNVPSTPPMKPMSTPKESAAPSSLDSLDDLTQNASTEAAVVSQKAAEFLARSQELEHEIKSTSGLKRTNSATCKKTLVLNSDQLSLLDLKPGPNYANFSVTTKMQGTTRCRLTIHRWRYDDHIVISDIDGTITRSDALGHVFYILGKDWTHSNIASLYSKIADNGYRLLYLSSRAIGQSDITKAYLRGIYQDHNTLPEAPVLLSPDRLVTSFHREVILKKPEEFKIACLKIIKDLFPPDRRPFYAGFGNRITDEISYRAVDVPTHRIFIINPKGDLKTPLSDHAAHRTSYKDLGELSDQIFPCLNHETSDNQEEFNDFTFWMDSSFD